MIFKCLGVAVIAVLISAVLRNVLPSILPFVGWAAGILILLLCIEENRSSINYYYELCTGSGYGDYFEVMLKGLGVAFLSNIGCDLCRDCGEAQLASKVEFAAKTEILVIALPLVKSLIELSEKILVT